MGAHEQGIAMGGNPGDHYAPGLQQLGASACDCAFGLAEHCGNLAPGGAPIDLEGTDDALVEFVQFRSWSGWVDHVTGFVTVARPLSKSVVFVSIATIACPGLEMPMSPTAPCSGHRSRRALVLLPIVPALALLSAVWLPFVNTTTLWWGMPPLFLWTAVWVLLITPTLAVVEWAWSRPRNVGEDQ